VTADVADIADAVALSDAQLETAIARRNLTWAHLEAAHELLDAAKREGVANLAEYIGNYNKAQDAFEWAVRELVRVRVNHQFDRGTHWTRR
jgi:hypothetical protein